MPVEEPKIEESSTIHVDMPYTTTDSSIRVDPRINQILNTATGVSLYDIGPLNQRITTDSSVVNVPYQDYYAYPSTVNTNPVCPTNLDVLLTRMDRIIEKMGDLDRRMEVLTTMVEKCQRSVDMANVGIIL
jgi:tetrahydromethanopterin S-methyltransferase subunit B